MRNFNIVKIDSKGRIIVPSHIRGYLGLKEGTELIVANNGNKELRIFPLLTGSSARINITASETPTSLPKILDILFKNNIEILMSMSKSIDRGKLLEWTAIADVSGCENIKKVEELLKKTKLLKTVEFDFK